MKSDWFALSALIIPIAVIVGSTILALFKLNSRKSPDVQPTIDYIVDRSPARSYGRWEIVKKTCNVKRGTVVVEFTDGTSREIEIRGYHGDVDYRGSVHKFIVGQGHLGNHILDSSVDHATEFVNFDLIKSMRLKSESIQDHLVEYQEFT